LAAPQDHLFDIRAREALRLVNDGTNGVRREFVGPCQVERAAMRLRKCGSSSGNNHGLAHEQGVSMNYEVTFAAGDCGDD
jgi:hypothetical protein